jgi:membrane protease YdiL (CAAX protease family)
MSAGVATTRGGLVRIMRSHPLTSFFVMAYTITWLLWLPAILWDLPRIALLPGIAIGVTGSALVMTAAEDGRNGVGRFLHRFTQWRVGSRWYSLALLLVPLSAVAAAVLTTTSAAPVAALLPSSLPLLAAAFLHRFYLGPLWEEAGWRGFALPRMQKRYGPLVGTLVLGLLWGFWHLAVYLPDDIATFGLAGGLAQFATFVVFSVALAFVFTWVYNNTEGSLLLAMLLHLSVNGTQTYFELLAAEGAVGQGVAAALQNGLALGTAAAAIVIIFATRGGLGYRGDRR